MSEILDLGSPNTIFFCNIHYAGTSFSPANNSKEL